MKIALSSFSFAETIAERGKKLNSANPLFSVVQSGDFHYPFINIGEKA